MSESKTPSEPQASPSKVPSSPFEAHASGLHIQTYLFARPQGIDGLRFAIQIASASISKAAKQHTGMHAFRVMVASEQVTDKDVVLMLQHTPDRKNGIGRYVSVQVVGDKESSALHLAAQLCAVGPIAILQSMLPAYLSESNPSSRKFKGIRIQVAYTAVEQLSCDVDLLPKGQIAMFIDQPVAVAGLHSFFALAVPKEHKAE
jgi:hypothetical protein